MEIFWSVPSAVSSSSSSSINHPLSVHWALHKSQKGPPLSNFNPRSISNQQHYIGNHQNLLKEKKANFLGLYISVWDPPHWLVCEYGPEAAAQLGEARRRQTVFVYEDQVFSAADGSQRGSISHQAQSCRVQTKVTNCTSSSVSICQSCSPHTFVSQ